MNKLGNSSGCWSSQMAKTMKLLREIRGLGLREHAALLGLSPATLSRIEHGKKCDVDTLVHIHRKTGVKLSTLLGTEAAASDGEKA